MKCNNCGSDLDFKWMVKELVVEMLENSDSKEELKNYFDTEFDFSIDNACDICYHTLWVKSDDRKIFYDTLDTLNKI